MTPSARVNACIEVLEKIGGSRVPMDATIGDYMRHRRYIGSKDRAAIVERVYDIMRDYAKLSWWIEKLSLEDTSRLRLILWITLAQKPGLKAIEAFFDGSKYGPEVLTADEKALITKLNGETYMPDEMPEYIQLECPEHAEAELREIYGDKFAEEMKAMMIPATLDLRVNVAISNLEDVEAQFAKEKIDIERTPFSPWGLRLPNKIYLAATKPFKKGWVDIQDEGSQLIAYICQAESGQQVMDYCAGAGGKTLAIAAAMKNKGRIIAMDIEKSRLDKARKRFRRAHVNDMIEPRPIDDKNKKWLRRQKGHFDIVLADVPCSGSGTWRRNPDTKWFTYGPQKEELVNVQADILERTAKLVKPGGHLVYATCSLFRDENEYQIDKFLESHPEFRVVPLEEFWNGTPPCKGPYMRLSPALSKTDGFFAARLERVATEAEKKEMEARAKIKAKPPKEATA